MARIDLPAILSRSFRQANGRAWRSIDISIQSFHLVELQAQPVVFEATFLPGFPIQWIEYDGDTYRPLLTNHSIPLDPSTVAGFQLDDIIIRQSMNDRARAELWEAPHPDYPFCLDLSGHALSDPWNRARTPGPLRRNGYWPEEVAKFTSTPMTFIEHEGLLLRRSSDLGWIVHLEGSELEITPWTGFEPAWVGPGVVFGATHAEQMGTVIADLGWDARNTVNVDPLNPVGLHTPFQYQGNADLATLRLIVHAIAAYHAPDLSDFEPEVAAWYWKSRACLSGRSELGPPQHLADAVAVLASTRFEILKRLSKLLDKRNQVVWFDPDLETLLASI